MILIKTYIYIYIYIQGTRRQLFGFVHIKLLIKANSSANIPLVDQKYLFDETNICLHCFHTKADIANFQSSLLVTKAQDSSSYSIKFPFLSIPFLSTDACSYLSVSIQSLFQNVVGFSGSFSNTFQNSYMNTECIQSMNMII